MPNAFNWEKKRCRVGGSSAGNDRLASNMVMTRTSKIGREAVRLNTPLKAL